MAASAPDDAAPQTVTLKTTAQAVSANGTQDPSVEALVGASWVQAKAYNSPYEYESIRGTGYVNTTGDRHIWPGGITQRYRIAFDLPAGAQHVSLKGQMLADNRGTAYVNDTAAGAQPDVYSTANFRWVDRTEQTGMPFGTDAPGAFLPGQRNYLYFDVNNYDGPIALDFLATLTFDASSNHAPACGGARAGSGDLWPPNHKFVTVDGRISGVTDPDPGDSVTTRIIGVTQDEPLNDLGDGDTSPDAVLVNDRTVQVRAERSGLGDGRVYAVTFTATDRHGATCEGSATIGGVPHDQGKGATAIDSGQTVNSLG